MPTFLSSSASARFAIAFSAFITLPLPCHAMTWTFPGSANAPSTVVSVASISPTQMLSVGNSGESRLLDTGALTWSVRASMTNARSEFALTTLTSGQLLATGGAIGGSATNSVERYSAATNVWSLGAPMLNPRRSHLAVRLAGGNVLVVAGVDGSNALTRSVELFDETAGTWAGRAPAPWDVSSVTGRGFALSDGRAVIVHSMGIGLYNPSTNTWTDAATPPTAGSLPAVQFAAAQLDDGRVAVSTMGVYDATNNTWATIPTAPRAFTTAAAINGNRAIFSGGELVPCVPSLFCQSNFAYEYSAATNQWLNLGNQIGTQAPDLSLADGGGYFAGFNQTPANGYSMYGALYRRSSIYQIYISNEFDLPLSPAVGQSYPIGIGYSAQSDILSRPISGTVTISDGTTSCQLTLPAASCTITTTVAGAKTLTVTYAGDDNFAPAMTTYTPRPHVIVERNAPTYVSSAPSGIYDIGFLYSTYYPFPSGTSVTLSASPPGSSTFTGWLGDCVGIVPCTFAMPADRHVRVKAFSAPTANAPFSIDVDRDGAASAVTDGLVILRYLLAYSDGTIRNGATPATGSPPGGSVVGYLSGIRPRLDVDGNGQADALTDGLLILRYLAGFRGDALIANCIGINARRSTVAEIEAYLATLLP
jgi:hypothetical protein